MARVLAVLVAVLTAALAGASYSLLEARERLGGTLARVEAVESLLEAERAWNDRLRRGVQAVEVKYSAESTELQAALDASPEWGAGAVPAGVRARLCEHGDCREASRAELPAP